MPDDYSRPSGSLRGPDAPRRARYNGAMTRDHQHNPDPNENAARIVAGSQAHENEPAPADLEAAWQGWSRHIQKVDERGMTLLRAAFEAGWEAHRHPS